MWHEWGRGEVRKGLGPVKVKVKQAHYKPGVAQRFPGKLRFPDFMTTAQDGGKVVSLTHRLPLLPGKIHLVLISVRG